jgi:hypothetical protein
MRGHREIFDKKMFENQNQQKNIIRMKSSKVAQNALNDSMDVVGR